jgi:hypothetical protein
MLVIGGISNWHYEVSLSTRLIDSFVQGVEKQVADSIERYRTSRDNGTLTVYDVSTSCDSDEETSDSIGASRTVEVHQGLDDETWDLDELFERYFPNLQRRSALLPLWGFAEYELHKLCLLYQSENHFEKSVFDFGGKDRGIDLSVNYLQEIAGLKRLKTSQQWVQLKALQEIRNVIAHNDGRLNGPDGKPKSKVLSAMKKVGYVKGDFELIFEQEFLSNALKICCNYFTILGTAIKDREP